LVLDVACDVRLVESFAVKVDPLALVQKAFGVAVQSFCHLLIFVTLRNNLLSGLDFLFEVEIGGDIQLVELGFPFEQQNGLETLDHRGLVPQLLFVHDF